RRGDWGAAVPAYDAAVRDGDADALRLRVERLVGFFALNDTGRLARELDALGRGGLGDLAAPGALLPGARPLCGSAQEARGRALVQRALADRGHLFSAADVAFAEALAAGRLGESVAALRRAVDADPLHYLASGSLAVALAAAGEREEARRQARFLRA